MTKNKKSKVVISMDKKTPDQASYQTPKPFSIAKVHPTNESALLKIGAALTAAGLGMKVGEKVKAAAEKMKNKKNQQINNALNEACWKNYKQVGMKMKGKKKVPNCVPVDEQMMQTDQQKFDSELRKGYNKSLPDKKRIEVLKKTAQIHPSKLELANSYKSYKDFISEAKSASWQRKAGKSEAGGLNEKGRRSYEREHPGSDLKAPSKKVGNPRRKRFCSRMQGMKEKLTSAKTANDPNSRINKSLRAWNC